MPKLYDLMVRMNDEDIRKEYMVQMEIILNDDPSVSERVKGIAEGMSIKLGEMQQMVRAFGRVEQSFQFFARSWSRIVELISIYQRLRAFERTISKQEVDDSDRELETIERAQLIGER